MVDCHKDSCSFRKCDSTTIVARHMSFSQITCIVSGKTVAVVCFSSVCARLSAQGMNILCTHAHFSDTCTQCDGVTDRLRLTESAKALIRHAVANAVVHFLGSRRSVSVGE